MRLLDPDRFHDYSAFAKEEAGFEAVAEQVALLLDGSESERSAARTSIQQTLDTTGDVPDNELISALLDRHGTGRVLFRKY